MRLPGTFNIGYNNDLLPLSVFTVSKSKEKDKNSEPAADLKNEKSKQTKSQDKLMAEPATKENNDAKDTEAANQAAAATGGTPTFTSKQDAMLIKMKKEEKKTWKEIATALGKEVGEVKERWKGVRPDKQGDASAIGDTVEKREAKSQEANRKEKRKDNEKASEDDTPLALVPDHNFSDEEVRLKGSVHFFGRGHTDVFISLTCSPTYSRRSSRRCGAVLPVHSGRRLVAKSTPTISKPKSPAWMNNRSAYHKLSLDGSLTSRHT
jgi:hypothetical protein